MSRLIDWLWPDSHPHARATLDGARAVNALLDKQLEGKRIKRSEWERVRSLLDAMPSYEDFYQRDPSPFDDWFRGF